MVQLWLESLKHRPIAQLLVGVMWFIGSAACFRRIWTVSGKYIMAVGCWQTEICLRCQSPEIVTWVSADICILWIADGRRTEQCQALECCCACARHSDIERVEVWLHSFLMLASHDAERLVSFMSRSLGSQGNNCRYSLNGRLGSSETSGRFREGKSLQPLPGIEPVA